VSNDVTVHESPPPICPHCDKPIAFAMRIDPIPGVFTNSVATFTCPKCRRVLAMCLVPRELAMELNLEPPKPQ
jgi:hypothetical protein